MPPEIFDLYQSRRICLIECANENAGAFDAALTESIHDTAPLTIPVLETAPLGGTQRYVILFTDGRQADAFFLALDTCLARLDAGLKYTTSRMHIR